MNVISYVTLLNFVVTLNAFVRSKGCLYGWHLSDHESTCYVNCLTSHLYFTNVYCKFSAIKNVNFSYDSSTNVLSMPSGETMPSASLIPPCHNVTLQNNQYDFTTDGFIRIASYLMEISLKNVIKMTLNNVTLYYPSSPQLLQCDTLSALPGSYKIINGTVLSVPGKKITALLGDFYLNDEAIAFFCAQSSPNVSFTQLPRCNMAVLQHTDYTMNEDGSMIVHKANVTIKNPLYTINYSQHAIVCFPLNFNYLNCPHNFRIIVGQYNYKLYSNLTLLDYLYPGLVDPFDYYITIDSQLTTCVNQELLIKPLAILHVFICSFYLLSSFMLFLTVMVKFRMFVHNYHKRCLLCHIVSLAIACFSLGVLVFYDKVEVVSCYFLFVLYYFFNMAAFMWLNIVAYDAWRIFSRIKTVRQLYVACDNCRVIPCGILAHHHGVLRFVAYNLLSWSVAAILTATILFLDLFVSPYDFSYEIRPYVFPTCFFATTKPFVLFFICPLIATTITNLIFLGLTIRLIHRASLGTEMVNFRRQNQVFNISIKLFILMGLCWTIDSFCFTFSLLYGNIFKSWYYFMAMIITSLQGVIISIIYLARKNVYNYICACRNKATGAH